MKNSLWMLSIKLQNILSREEGQDLIEYALVVALIAFCRDRRYGRRRRRHQHGILEHRFETRYLHDIVVALKKLR